MTKKVWGFKGEDIFIFEKKGKKHILVERVGDEVIQGNLAFELVPVVSLTTLKRLCKRHALLPGIKPNLVDIDELLSAVREKIEPKEQSR